MYATAIREAFGDRAFSPAEASLVLGIRSPESTLSRLKAKGEVELVERGKYRAADKGLASTVEANRRRELRRTILTSPINIALDGPDAVAAWTRGRYNVGRSPWNDPLYVVVDEEAPTAFEELLRALKVPWDSAERPPRARGLYVIARFKSGLSRVDLEGTPVVDRNEVLRLIRENPLAYEGAEELIRD